MNHNIYRKHPRVYSKKNDDEDNERTLTLSAVAAAGILTVIFLKGMFLGYILKRKLDN